MFVMHCESCKYWLKPTYIFFVSFSHASLIGAANDTDVGYAGDNGDSHGGEDHCVCSDNTDDVMVMMIRMMMVLLVMVMLMMKMMSDWAGKVVFF